MILENTFTSIEKLIFHYAPSLGPFSKFILRNRWDSEDSIKNIRAPILLIKCIFHFPLRFLKKSSLKTALKDELVPSFMLDGLKEKAVNARFRDEVFEMAFIFYDLVYFESL